MNKANHYVNKRNRAALSFSYFIICIKINGVKILT